MTIDEEKRETLRELPRRQMKYVFQMGAAMPEEPNIRKDMPEPMRQLFAEANDVATGDRSLADTSFGFTVALLRSVECLDLVIVPLALFLAYKVALREASS